MIFFLAILILFAIIDLLFIGEDRDMQERRCYSRLPVNLPVRYSEEPGTVKPTKEAVSKNISQSGLLFTTNKPIPISINVILEFPLPDLSSYISAEGRVVRTEEINPGRLYDIGIVFTKIKPNDLQVIREYIQAVDLNKILSFAVKNKASDIHLTVNQPPTMRVFGALIPMHTKQLTPEEMKGLLYGFLTEEQIKRFETELELDTSLMTDFGRFRVNIHKEKGHLGAAFRYIPTEIKTIEELGLPPAIGDLARKPNGLILVTGPAGSGKSTTLAAMIDIINEEKDCMIISLEDPIEYIHKSKKSIVKQREIGVDSLSFVNALKHSMRQDVDVILVGEMRDMDSIYIAIIAAETGHLVLSTLQTSDATASLGRVIDIFPHQQQQQIRMLLAENLRGIISQILIQKENKPERVVATEVLVVTPAVKNIIRHNQFEQIPATMELSLKYGMHLMDRSIEHLYREGIISREKALIYLKNPSKFI